jgi:monothiol glutaredoxin
MSRTILAEANIEAAAMQAIQGFHADTVAEVAKAVSSNKIVIVGMKQNPVVKKARNLLDSKNLGYTYLEYGSYFSEWKKRLAIKLWSGWPTYPQVFIDGKLVGGCSELEKSLAKT